ncbi:MAG: TIGR03118 family protein [Acidobacteriia bacterium]|nr:TIGR03118 family protein [Terriglobia bacterium]
MAGAAAHTDPRLINPWGIAFVPGQPFWVADNNSGFATTYDANGVSQFNVLIPAPRGSASPATPTGVVVAQTGGFILGGAPSQFLVATEDGTISGWNGTGNAILAIDHSTAGAVYKGLAILSPACCATFLVVANFHSGSIEAYTLSFEPLAPPGSFTDPGLPAGFAPFNIQQVGDQVFVTYAKQDAAKHDPVNAPGNGIVDIFDLEGNFVERYALGGTLNSPWSVVQASKDFGRFSNDILIGNFGDGTINAFDPATGDFLGQLKDQTGATITNASLWGLVFGAGGTGDTNTLYFTAGLANEGHGLFGAITAAAEPTLDYSLTVTPQDATVAAGGSANFTLTITPANGFAGTVSLSCAAPTGVTCAFNPPTVTPGAGAATSILTATTSTSVQHYGRLRGMGTLLASAGLFCCFFAGVGRSRRGLHSRLLAGFAITLILGSLIASTGCGSGGGISGSNRANRGTASIVITATSGALSHTSTINLTVQ